MNAGAINFLIKRFDEHFSRATYLKELPGSFRPTTATVGLRATSRAGFEHMHVLA
jgi:hypothetical protein